MFVIVRDQWEDRESNDVHAIAIRNTREEAANRLKEILDQRLAEGAALSSFNNIFHVSNLPGNPYDETYWVDEVTDAS